MTTMEFDPTLLMLSVIPSDIGFVLFTYRRNEHRWPQLLCGLLLIVYPYFTGTVSTMIAVGIFLGAGLYFMLAAGW